MLTQIFLVPEKSTFDVSALERQLTSNSDWFCIRDPLRQNESVFFCSGSNELAEYARSKRVSDPAGPLPSVCIVEIKADRIFIGQQVPPAQFPLCRQIIQSIRNCYKTRVLDEYGTDITHLVANNLDAVYE